MAIPDFPNGFESWQKTHFEIVEALCYLRDLEEEEKSKNFADLVDRSASEEMYQLARTLTNKFEEQTKSRKREQSLFDEIEEFVTSEVRNL